MTGRERVERALNRQSTDRCPAKLNLWSETRRRWTDEGHLKPGEDDAEHFDLDMRRGGGIINSIADIDFEPVTLEEDENTILQLDGNGAKYRTHKHQRGTPEHVDFTVTDRAAWEEQIKPHLLDVDRRRMPIDAYRAARDKCRADDRFFYYATTAPFEQMHRVCGHEYLLMGMAMDPDWGKDMAMTYADFTIRHLETLFDEEGTPDGMFYFEDMGFKGKPFMSTPMYDEIMKPGHKRLFDFAHSKGLKVMVHSCGYVEPLVPGLIEAGMDCLQAMEVKAGMDMAHLAREFGDRISFFGGIDVRTLIANDREAIEAELQAKLPAVYDAGSAYILHTDHSEPSEIDYETIRFFLDRGREISAECMRQRG